MSKSNTPTAVFFGTPAFAVPSLKALTQVCTVAAVVSQPDRPTGRGMKIQPTAVKAAAEQLGIQVLQPEKIKSNTLFLDTMRSWKPDIAVVVAYGKILPASILQTPTYGCVNVHASLLPRWRGAAPVQWAIAECDRETGVTLMLLDEGMDTGPTLAKRVVPISSKDTSVTLAARLSHEGAVLLGESLPLYLEGALSPVAQPTQGVTHARMITKDDGKIDWKQSAELVSGKVRAMQPWPVAFSLYDNKRVRIHACAVIDSATEPGKPGEIVFASPTALHVACGKGLVSLLELQLDGKRKLEVKAFQAGQHWEVGKSLG